MESKVTIILNNKEYELVYNDTTKSYEANIEAPNETGLHIIEIIFESEKEIATSNADLIVLKKEEKKTHINEVVAYFLDKKSFEIIDVSQLNIEEINKDLETNINSSFTSIRKLNIEENDFIFLKKDDEMNFLGLIASQEKNDNDNIYTLTCKDVLSLFDIDMFVEDEDIISEIGIEDFIAKKISDEFIENNDVLFNRNYLSITALTHTTKNIQLSSIVNVSNGLYNLLTFIKNTIEKYDIQISFILEKTRLNVEIYINNENPILIDTTTSDIANYSEVFSLTYTTKVEVRNLENTNVYYRFLLNDRTTTTDVNDPNRIFGKVEKLLVEKESDSEQRALDKFKSNSYNHNITFEINKDSRLHEIRKMKLGTKVLIKTKNGNIYNTYISKIKDSRSKFLTVTCGNLRVEYIDKFLQDRRR